jgi:uncharacterized protein (TIGR04255 family)
MPDAAPIKHLMLTVQFQPAMLSLNVTDLAGLRAIFADDYPIFNQLNRAGPMGFSLEQVGMPFSVGAGMPRLQFVSSDLAYEILFQEDRVSFGWSRTAPFEAPSNYPGFESILARLGLIVKRISDYLSELDQPSASASSGEIVYTDVFIVPEGKAFGDSLPSIFNIFNAASPISTTGLNLVWNGELQLPNVEGFTQTSILGPEMSADGRLTAVMQSSAHFNLGGLSWESVPERFLAARGTIGRTFQALVNPTSFAMSS